MRTKRKIKFISYRLQGLCKKLQEGNDALEKEKLLLNQKMKGIHLRTVTFMEDSDKLRITHEKLDNMLEQILRTAKY